MIIKYGTNDISIDVTNICLSKLTNNNIIIIPFGDINRAYFFSDPCYGILKKIFIEYCNNKLECDEKYIIKINLTNKSITMLNETETYNKLTNIHSNLQLKYGTFDLELPEQLMVTRYLKGNEKVLEIGSNIGRNSLIISSILNEYNNINFVTLETDINSVNMLTHNRDVNNLKFHIENAALSKRKLIQKDWETIPSDTLREGYIIVNTITFEELKNKYNINFDTLVLDCEGAFYYILLDMPEILDNINLIIMENDYRDVTHKQYVDFILKKNNFYRDYVEPVFADIPLPCIGYFFEVWKK